MYKKRNLVDRENDENDGNDWRKLVGIVIHKAGNLEILQKNRWNWGGS